MSSAQIASSPIDDHYRFFCRFRYLFKHVNPLHNRSDASQKTNVWKIGKPNNMELQQSQPSACVLPVHFMLYKCYEEVWFDEEEDDVPRIIPQLKTLVTQETIKVPRGTLLSESGTMLMTEILSGMHVPVDEQPSIVGKVLNAVESTLCMLPIVVEVEEVTLRMSRNVINPEDVIERVTRESVETHEVKPIPATKSSIDSLEKVRLDSSEVTQNCVICMKNFEAGVEVIYLPCSHVYHGGCIVQWLETSHLCPLWRYPMPHVD